MDNNVHDSLSPERVVRGEHRRSPTTKTLLSAMLAPRAIREESNPYWRMK
jgi:hypothetical protein